MIPIDRSWSAADALVARAAGNGRTGLYVPDLAGEVLVRVSGAGSLPARIGTGMHIGPELPTDLVPRLERAVAEAVDGARLVPVVAAERVIAVLVHEGADTVGEREAGERLELISRFVDRFEAARRARPTTPAAEMQHGLLPPRVRRVGDMEVAGGVLPAYDVGGDWFDVVEAADAVWLAIADGVGKRVRAAAFAAAVAGGFRAARFNGLGLRATAGVMDASMREGRGSDHDFVTAVVARIDLGTFRVEWIACGHPDPLLLTAAGEVTKLRSEGTFPLGLFEPEREWPVAGAELGPGEALVLISDGVTERRRGGGGRIELGGVADTLSNAGGGAGALLEAVQAMVVECSPEPLRDDATTLVVRRAP
jgi:serine phosphatase RsbU (regulator of sigma subunit)